MEVSFISGQLAGSTIAPYSTSADLATRGRLTLSNGQTPLRLLKPGEALSATVPVLRAGSDVTVPESLTVTTLLEGEYPGLQDFIYWQPDAVGTGVEPAYIMFISPLTCPVQ